MSKSTYDHLSQEVQEEERTDAPVTRHQPVHKLSSKVEISWRYKLSLLTTVILSIAVLSIPAVIWFLCFLWTTYKAGDQSEFWLSIIRHGWMLRSITISALVIRTAASIIAVYVTSMLASIMLEHKGVTLHAAAPISAIRFINSGPLSLLIALPGTISHNWSWSGVTLLLVCTTTLLQFTSTVLVIDIGYGTLTVPAQSNATLAGMSMHNANQSLIRTIQPIPYWIINSESFPSFAEYTESGSGNGAPDSVRDTGTTLRAFLPFDNSAQRTSVKQFQGIATVTDSRTVCIRPRSHDGLAMALTKDAGWLLNGTLAPETVVPGLILPKYSLLLNDLNDYSISINPNMSRANATKMSLSWAQLIPSTKEANEWNIVQKLSYYGPVLISSLDPRYPEIVSRNTSQYDSIQLSTDAGFPTNSIKILAYNDSIPLMSGRSYVVLNVSANSDKDQVTRLINATDQIRANGTIFSSNQNLNKLVMTPHNEWLTLTIPRIPDFRVGITLCFDSHASADLQVNVTKDFPSVEPSPVRLNPGNLGNLSLDTTALRRQLGALPSEVASSNYTGRGIMTLHSTSEQLRSQIRGWYDESRSKGLSNISFPGQNFVSLGDWSPFAWGCIYCADCDLHYEIDSELNGQYPGWLQRNIFQDTVLNTGNVALAFQAYSTHIARTYYYDMIAYFDITDTPTVSWFRQAQFPQSSRGLTAVMVVLAVHLIAAFTIIIVFLCTTKFSLIGDNAWQSLAQAYSSKTERVLIQSTAMRDGEVEKRTKASGRDEVVSLGVMRHFEMRRVGIRGVKTKAFST